MRIGEIPEKIIAGPINVVSLLVAKRCLLEVNEGAATDPETGMKDAVANFMILCAHLGLDFETILDSARASFTEETSPNEIVSGPERSTRHMPGHYHLELRADEEGDEPVYINDTLEGCLGVMAITNRWLVSASFICQFGCGQEHRLNDNEKVLLGIHPASAGMDVWGRTEAFVSNLMTMVKETNMPK